MSTEALTLYKTFIPGLLSPLTPNTQVDKIFYHFIISSIYVFVCFRPWRVWGNPSATHTLWKRRMLHFSLLESTSEIITHVTITKRKSLTRNTQCSALYWKWTMNDIVRSESGMWCNTCGCLLPCNDLKNNVVFMCQH